MRKFDRSDFYVYLLFRYDGRPLYIGIGHGSRWLSHERSLKTETNVHKKNSIQKTIRLLGEVPKVKLFENITWSTACELEIAFIRSIGRHPNGPLVNQTDGGEGTLGYIQSAEKRRKCGHLRGKNLSSEWKRNIGLSNIGKSRPDLIERNRLALFRRKWINDGTKEIRIGHDEEIPSGYIEGRLPFSKESRQRMSVSQKKRVERDGYVIGRVIR